MAPGDRVQFEEFKYRRFRAPKYRRTVGVRLGERLDQGGLSRVFAVADDPTRVVRFAPSQISYFETEDWTYDTFISMMIEGYPTLRDHGVMVTRLHDHANGLFIIADRADGPTLAHVMKTPWAYGDEARSRMKTALADFARSTAGFARIGDFHSGQVAFSGGRWVLRDWHHGHARAGSKTSLDVFHDFDLSAAGNYFAQPGESPPRTEWRQRWTEHLLGLAHAAIRAARAKRTCAGRLD